MVRGLAAVGDISGSALTTIGRGWVVGKLFNGGALPPPMSTRHVALAIFVVAVMISAFGLGVAGSVHTASAASSAAATSAPAAKTSTLGNPSGSAEVQKLLALTKTDHIPMEALSLPNLLGHSTLSNGVVQPLTPAAPAPMGIATYGVTNTTGTPQAYSLETQSWEGSITLNSVNTFLVTNDGAISTDGSQNTFGVQLNAVTNDSTVGTHSIYSFWTQNVLYFNFPLPGYITFLDNVWNFSSPATALTAGTLYSYNGTPVYPSYYYDFGPSFAYTFPLTVQLYLNSSVTNLASTGYGYTTVKFGYNVINGTSGQSEGSGVYDTVLFNSATPIGSVPASPYLVDGSQVNPTGFIPWDAEIMIGGPGGGTTTSVYGISGSESLSYWDATTGNYAIPKDAWNVASETGETSEGIAESYVTPGTVLLNTGPSIPMPFWNATPGGNIGQSTFTGPLSPSNAFVFFTPGSSYDVNYAAWAPTQTASTFDTVLPPGTYTVDAMLSDYTPTQTTVTGTSGGTSTLTLNLQRNMAEGVYTPLFAWNNAQLAAISSGGSGTAASPYLLFNNPAPGGGLNSAFGEFNDYIYYVFPGVLLAGTTAYASLINPDLLSVTHETAYQLGFLNGQGLPTTNNLQFELFDASHVTIWGAQGITGWFFYLDYGPTGLLPLANVVIWGGTSDLVADSTFVSQGSALLLTGSDPSLPTGNVVWGNTFVNSTVLTPTMYPAGGAVNGPPVAIWGFESGDWIYNNFVDTSITAYAPNLNMFFGFGQLNAENWNLSQIEPANQVMVVNGYSLSGSIVEAGYQGGNYWGDIYGSPTPYDEYGYIATGGDFFPFPQLAIVVGVVGLSPGQTWSISSLGYTFTFSTPAAVIYVTPGAYPWTASVSGGGTISPSSGTVVITTHSVFEILTVT